MPRNVSQRLEVDTCGLVDRDNGTTMLHRQHLLTPGAAVRSVRERAGHMIQRARPEPRDLAQIGFAPSSLGLGMPMLTIVDLGCVQVGTLCSSRAGR